MEKPNYGAARFYFTIVSILGWIMIAAGVIVLFSVGSDTRNPSMAMLRFSLQLAAVSFVIIGFLTLVGVQIGRAVVDNARISWEMLEIMRKNQRSGGDAVRPPLQTAPAVASPSQADLSRRLELRDRAGKLHIGVLRSDGTVEVSTPVGPRVFVTEEEARAYFV